MNYWRVSSSSIRNFELGLKHKTWGFLPYWAKRCMEITKGDKVVIYVSNDHSFKVICEVTKERFIDHTPIWLGDDFPYRIGIEPLPISQKPIKLREVRELSKRPNLGGSFHPSFSKLTPEDFNIIFRMMTEK